jgi:large subunit ribosomal protein L21
MPGFPQKRTEGFIMYAVIKTGGKQYRVTPGEKIKVEQLPAGIGSQIALEVLMIADGDKISIGAPLVAGATVQATVVSHGRHDKVHIFKMRRRKHYQRHGGHRQNYTEIQIGAISA